MKAQGASEFLAIFAVVLLLSMIVVSLIGSEAGSPQGSSESESRIYWSSTAKPLQVESGSPVYGTLCEQEKKGGFELLVKNADPSSVMITAIEVEGTDAQFCEGNGREAESVDLAPYAKKFIGIITSDSLPCEEGRQASLSLRFSYAKDSIARVQNGTRELVVPCTVASPGQYLSTAPAK
jgi:hypothetical protein